MKRFYSKVKKYGAFNFVKLLFENKGDKQTILKNTFWLTAAQGISGIVNFFLIIYVIRTFGPTEYGKYAFAFSFVSLFSTLFDFGLSTTITREFARDKTKEKYLPDILILKIIIGMIILTIIFAGTFLISPDKFFQKLIFNISFYIFTLEIINLFYGFFRSQQKMEIEAIFRILQVATLALIVYGVISLQPSVLNLSYAYIGATLVTLTIILAFFPFKKNLISFQLTINKSIWKEFLVIGWYLALAKGVGDITMYSDSVILGYGGQITETGWYNAASRINGLVLFPMALVSSSIFPALIIILKDSKERFIKYWEFWMKGTVFFSVLLVFIVLSRANNIIEIAYSSEFLPAALALQILIFVAAFAYIHNIYFHTLLIFDQQKRIFFAMLISAIVNVALNSILVPRYSLYGAAVAAVATHFVTLCQFLVLASRYTIIKPFNAVSLFTLSISVISGILMHLGVNLMDAIKINSFISISAGILFYLLLIMFFNKIGKDFIYQRV